MAIWINGFDEVPIKQQLYFVRCNGKKELLRLDEFSRRIERSETFFWLDESEEENKKLAELTKITSLDEFARIDRSLVSKELLTKYSPKVSKSEVFKSFHKHYLKQIAFLRKQVSDLEKAVKKQKANGTYVPSPDKEDPLLMKIRLLNKNPFIDIKK